MPILPFMTGQDDPGPYQAAVDESLEKFTAGDPEKMAANAGAEYDAAGSTIMLSTLDQVLQIEHPTGEVTFRGSDRSPLWQWKLIALNYLFRADGTPLTGNLVAFRELDGGTAYHGAFYANTVNRLARVVRMDNLDKIEQVCRGLGGRSVDIGDVGATLLFLPRFPVTLTLWAGDDEMPSSANMLFDASANHYLHTEDASVVAGMIVDFVVRMMEDGE